MAEMKIGDTVTRNLAGAEMRLKVSDVTEDLIICGPWSFCKKTGAEVDEDLDWGPPPKRTGSFIKGL